MQETLSRSDILPEKLPDSQRTIAEGRALASSTPLTRTLFMEKYGVSSEREYKEKMRAKGHLMFHAHYGLSTWDATAEGLRYLYDEALKRGARVDRVGFILDRIMGLPQEMREGKRSETGLKLQSIDEWKKMGQIVPVALHFGDHVVGTPASTYNVQCALAAGSTTIGSFEHFFFFEYPDWADDVARAVELVRSVALLGGLRSRGVVVHSNLGDHESYFNLFRDRSSVIGWAMLERYVVEDLIGAELVHCFGNFSTNPLVRLAMLFAVNEIHGGETAGSMVYGNTMVPSDISRSTAVQATCLLYDIIGQMIRPTGHAVQGLPVTEAHRIPSPSEITDGLVMAAQLEIEALTVAKLIDLSEVNALKNKLLSGGRVFHDNVLRGFVQAGIDVRNPLEVLLGMRYLSAQHMSGLGALRLELLFGAGEPDPTAFGGRRPLVPTEMYEHAAALKREVRDKIHESPLRGCLAGKKVLLASTDLHLFGIVLLQAALQEAGATTRFIEGIAEPDDVLREAMGFGPRAVLVSTHNGMALTYGRSLLERLRNAGVSAPIYMGGRLNQDDERGMPQDVTDALRGLGIRPANDIVAAIEELRLLCA